MNDEGGSTRQSSYVRHGLGLLCVAAIGLAIGFAGRGDDSPAVGEQIAQVIGGVGGLLALVALAYIAYGLLRD